MNYENYKKVLELTGIEFNVSETLTLLRRYGYRFFSWGACNFSNINDKGLLFKSNGHHHKGYVFITLNGLDLYDVHILNGRFDHKETISDIYFDDLFDVIDKRIEFIPEYSH